MSKEEPVRLQRHNPAQSYFNQDLIIRISFTTLVMLAFILFIIICYLLQPPTYGFLWW